MHGCYGYAACEGAWMGPLVGRGGGAPPLAQLLGEAVFLAASPTLKGNLARSCCHYGADYPEESGGVPGDLSHLFNKLDGARSLKQAMW